VRVPPFVQLATNEGTPYGQCDTDHEIDDIMVSQVDGGENEAADNGEEDIKENFLIATGQE
jgi:hypothetical protein